MIRTTKNADLASRSDDLAGQLDAGQEIGCLVGIEVRMDRGEHRVRISVGKFNVAGRDLDHMRTTTISAGLHRRTEIAPTNCDLLHVYAPDACDGTNVGSAGIF
jgi:hypothetical protein